MSDFPWPDPVTLAAGDEDLLVDPWALAFAIANVELSHYADRQRELDRRQTDNSDGHLEDDDHWRRHPDGS